MAIIRTNLGWVVDSTPTIEVTEVTSIKDVHLVYKAVVSELEWRLPLWRVNRFTHGYGVDGVFIIIDTNSASLFKKIKRHLIRCLRHVHGVDTRCFYIERM